MQKISHDSCFKPFYTFKRGAIYIFNLYMNNVLLSNEAPRKGQIIIFIIPFKPNNTA